MVHILTGYEVPVRFSTHPDRLRSSCQVVYLITNNEQIIINQRKSASKKIINQRQSAKISVNIFLLFFQRKSAFKFIIDYHGKNVPYRYMSDILLNKVLIISDLILGK